MAEPETAKAAAAIAASDLQVVANDPAGTRSLNHLTPASLADQHWLLELPNDVELDKLRALGVPEAALWEPYPLRVANVRFIGTHLFEFDPAGKRAFVVRADDADHCADLIAIRGEQLGSLYSVGFAAGDFDAITNPASYFAGGALQIHRGLVPWLKAGRRGLIIVRPLWAYGFLKDVREIECDDEEHRLELTKLMQPPKLRMRIRVAKQAEAAA
jgi:hypothetical protein